MITLVAAPWKAPKAAKPCRIVSTLSAGPSLSSAAPVTPASGVYFAWPMSPPLA